MMTDPGIELLRMIGDFILVPIAVMLWNLHGRIAKIEGILARRFRGEHDDE